MKIKSGYDYSNLDIHHIPNYFGKLNLIDNNMALSEAEISKISEIKRSGKVPKHVAIIMDGNGRWAKSHGFPRVVGHQEGIKTVRRVVETSAELDIEYLTLYTFSTENWQRPQDEVSTLMQLIVKSLRTEIDDLHKNDIRVTAIGDLGKLPPEVQEELYDAFERTKNNKRMNLNLALSYSGRLELINAVKTISEKVKNNKLNIEDIDENLISSHLFTKNMPDPDLLIRTGGEMRVSNFLLWQIAYSEIYVTQKLWPEFSVADYLDAITDYGRRERRFGLVSEQIQKNGKQIDNAKNDSTASNN